MTEGALQPVIEWLDFYGRTDKKDTINAIIEAIAQVNPKGSYAIGDILYASTIDKMALLAKGSSGQILEMGASIPFWSSASQFALWDSDNSPAVTRFYSVDAYAVSRATRANGTHDWSYDETNRWATNNVASFFTYLPINLPHGAIVTALRVTSQRVVGADLTTFLARHTRSGTTYTIMASVISATSMTEVSDTSISSATIDNDLFGYTLRWNIDNTGEKRVRGIQIDYTVVRPQP